MKKKIIIGIFFILLIAIGVVINIISKKPKKVEITKNNNNYTSELKIVCQIKGEVTRPGVYNLEKGARLQDLVLAAGGFTSSADTNSVSLVSILEDSTCYVINQLQDGNDNITNNLININTASKEELMTLPNIGEAKAIAIVEYREQNGNYISVSDLTKVNGISEKILSQIIDKICVR